MALIVVGDFLKNCLMLLFMDLKALSTLMWMLCYRQAMATLFFSNTVNQIFVNITFVLKHPLSIVWHTQCTLLFVP